jgi:integration host factor subunit beta
MTKKDIAKKVADQLDISHLTAIKAVQVVLDEIVETVVTEGRIELRNFGIFEVKKRRPRQARNPRSGEKVSVPARVVVRFKPGREMEQRVRQLKKVPAKK